MSPMDHRQVDVARRLFEGVDVEHAVRGGQRDADGFRSDHGPACYPRSATRANCTADDECRPQPVVRRAASRSRGRPASSSHRSETAGARAHDVLGHQRRHRAARLPRASSTPSCRSTRRSARSAARSAFPFRYGYSCVGVVEESRCGARRRGRSSSPSTRTRTASSSTPTDVVAARLGRARVQATLFPLVETALQITLDAGPVLGETVVVFGLGVVGVLTVALLQRAGRRRGRRRAASLAARRRRDGLGVVAVAPEDAADDADRPPGGPARAPRRSRPPATRTSCRRRWPCSPTRARRWWRRGTARRRSRCRSAASSTAAGSRSAARRCRRSRPGWRPVERRIAGGEPWSRCSTSFRSTALATHTFPFEDGRRRLRRDRRGRRRTDPRRAGVH